MPKVTPKKPATSARSNLFVFKYGSKCVMAKRQRCYRTAIKTCRSLFPSLPQDFTITFNTKDLEICANEMTEISEESREGVIDQLDCVEVIVEEKGNSIDAVDAAHSSNASASEETFVISVTYIDGRSFRMKVSPSTRVTKVLDGVGKILNECVDDLRFIYRGSRLGYWRNEFKTLEDYDFDQGDEIQCLREQKGGKPVIYLSSSTAIEASVTLSLAPQWDFSAIYPVVPIKQRTEFSNQEISWKVKVHPNGDLTELTTGLDVAYLFWEAHTNSSVARSATPPPSPGGVPSEDVDIFYPNDADLNKTDSVVLSIDKITPYLDKTLTALCLHTEARTSFITYWLPSLLKHKHVALHFVSQKPYEHAAPLSVSPPPDIVTRIFMVFKGVADDELSQWSVATNQASEDVHMWQDIVGIDCERARDTTLFRVLEWGGMEVLRKT